MVATLLLLITILGATPADAPAATWNHQAPPRSAAPAEVTPAGPDIKIHHARTFRLGGGKPGSGIRHVLNNTGGETIQSQKKTVP